jgi:hypothetical protein
MVPLAASVKPAGKVPELTTQLYGGVPPEAINALEYALPATPEGSDVVVIDRVEEPDVIVIDNGLDADCAGELESVTFTVKLLDCADAVGVPLMVPLEASVKPAGKLPELTTQLYGVFPPVALNALEYALPAVLEGSNVVVIDKVEEPDVIVIDNGLDADCAGELESVTFTVKLLDCADAVTVPLIVPLEARVKPAGKLPELTTQLYGVFPPVALNALEYELPAVLEGSNVVVINKVEEPEVIAIDNVLDADCAGELESVTFTVKLLDCAEDVGVPLMVPLEASVKPAGKLPELTAQL